MKNNPFSVYGYDWRSKWTVAAAGGGVPKIFRLTWTFHCTFVHAQGRINPYHGGRSISVRPETPRRLPLHRIRKTPPPPPPPPAGGDGDTYRTDMSVVCTCDYDGLFNENGMLAEHGVSTQWKSSSLEVGTIYRLWGRTGCQNVVGFFMYLPVSKFTQQCRVHLSSAARLHPAAERLRKIAKG